MAFAMSDQAICAPSRVPVFAVASDRSCFQSAVNRDRHDGRQFRLEAKAVAQVQKVESYFA